MGGTDGRYSAPGKFSEKFNDNLSMSAPGSASRMPGSGGMGTKYGGQVGLDYKKDNFSVGGFVGQDVINGKRDTKAGIGPKVDLPIGLRTVASRPEMPTPLRSQAI
jgi:hypothetical protein